MRLFKSEIFSQPKSDLIKRIIFALLGDIFIGLAISFNASARLGNDPISVFFDGLRNAMGLPMEKLGVASNIACYTLLVLVFIIEKSYVNIGTFIYVLPLGFFVNLGVRIYDLLNIPNLIIFRILMSTIGCFLLFLGIALFIVAEIGLDSWTGLVMIIKDKTKKPYKIVKILVDILTLLVGFILGGKVGIVTVFAAILGGPIINYFVEIMNKYLFRITRFKVLPS